MKTLNATDFKAGCLAFLDQVSRTGETIAITKRGRPIAQLIPMRPANLRFPQDALRGTVTVIGDILSPVLPASAWEAEHQRHR